MGSLFFLLTPVLPGQPRYVRPLRARCCFGTKSLSIRVSPGASREFPDMQAASQKKTAAHHGPPPFASPVFVWLFLGGAPEFSIQVEIKAHV